MTAEAAYLRGRKLPILESLLHGVHNGHRPRLTGVSVRNLIRPFPIRAHTRPKGVAVLGAQGAVEEKVDGGICHSQHMREGQDQVERVRVASRRREVWQESHKQGL